MAAKKKGKPGSGKKKLKVSSSKLSNKHLNKLGKQGKLKNEKWKQKIKARKAEKGRLGNELQYKREQIKDVEDELDEEDFEFYGKHQNSFVSKVKHREFKDEDGSSSKKGRKRKLEDEDMEDYEQLPRKLVSNDNNRKMMLPIKTKHGLVARHIEKQDNQLNGDIGSDGDGPSDMEDGGSSGSEDVKEELPVLSGVELYARRQRTLHERRQKIALLASSIVENPEQGMKKLRDLVSMLNERDPDVYVTVRKLTMVSLLEVFKDIIPGYYVRLPTDKEKHQKMKKDTKAILDHEIALVRCYNEYLEFLDKTAKGSKVKKEDKSKKTTHWMRRHKKPREEEEAIPAESQTALQELAVRCLCDLLIKHPHFNYRNNIIMVVVPYMNNNNTTMSDSVCNCVRQAFREDKSGEVTLEITKAITKMIKAREYRVKPKVLDTFLTLRIKEVSYTDPVVKEEIKKQHTDKMSRREKKKHKKNMFLERGLEESKATEDKRRRLKLHTETIQQVFLTYFRILKKATDSKLLPSVLEGLAKFAHLINVDFFDDLFAVFNKLIAEEVLSYRESLHCVQTAFTILSGQGTVLNIDPVKFYKHLYKNLYHVHAGCTCEDIKIVLDCLDIMVNKRKRQISQHRLLAFMKRLMSLSLQQTSPGTISLMAAVRSMMITYTYSDVLMDNEAQGSGVYLPELDDPEHCHAHNTMLWELALLKHHFDPTVRKLCSHLSRGAPTTGEGQLPPDLRKAPGHLLKVFDEMDFFNQYVPEKARSAKRKVFKMDGFRQSEFGDELLSRLREVNDSLDVT